MLVKNMTLNIYKFLRKVQKYEIIHEIVILHLWTIWKDRRQYYTHISTQTAGWSILGHIKTWKIGRLKMDIWLNFLMISIEMKTFFGIGLFFHMLTSTYSIFLSISYDLR